MTKRAQNPVPGSSDPGRAAAFYTEVFGWRIESVGTDEQRTGDLQRPRPERRHDARPPQAGARSHWLGYFATTDIDGMAARIPELRGRVLVPPLDIPNGRISMAQDPQGATFALFAGDLDP